MISTVGYVPISALLRARLSRECFIDWHDALWTNMFMPRTDLHETLMQVSPGSIVEQALWHAVARDAYLCSPSGDVRHIDIASLLAVLAGSRWAPITVYDLEAARGARELPPFPPPFYQRYGMPPGNIIDLAAKNSETIDGQAAFRDTMYDSGYPFSTPLVPICYERVGYTVDLGAYDLALELNAMSKAEIAATAEAPHLRSGWRQYEHIVELLRPFVGWSFCVTSEFADGDWQANMEEEIRFLITCANPSEAARTVAVGRPRERRERTAMAYARIYPNGHGSEQWLRVLAKVNAESGVAASLETLKRAIDLAQNTAKVHSEPSTQPVQN